MIFEIFDWSAMKENRFVIPVMKGSGRCIHIEVVGNT